MYLKAKVKKPDYPPAIVGRTRLHSRLESWRSVRAVVLHAPSGYGKSTLVSHWIDVAGLTAQTAWLSLDEHDVEPHWVIGQMAAALDAVAPGTLSVVQPILDDPHGDVVRALHRMLTTLEQTSPDGHRLLVLDDLHRVESPVIDDLLTTMLKYGPAHLHLILISRVRPSLPLTRFYADGSLVVLTTDDLRFTAAEIAAYLTDHGFAPPNAAEVCQLMEMSEGWITALRLGVLAAGHNNSAAVIKAMQGSSDWLSDYLAEEVLHRQDATVRRFLLQTSILETFTAPLCAAVTGMDNAAAVLKQIATADLFLIPLDRAQGWYRYHHLFQELLQRRLVTQEEQTTIAMLHRTAAAWFFDAGMVGEAVRHLLAAGDLDEAVTLVEAEARAVMLQDPYRAQRLLNLVPNAQTEERPGLALARGRLAFLFDAVDLDQVVQRAEVALDRVPDLQATMPAWRGEYWVLRTAVAHFRGDVDEALAMVEEVQPFVDHLDDFMVGSLNFLRMHLAFRKGLNAQAANYGETALTALMRAQFGAGVISLQRELARWMMRKGDTRAANQRFREILQEQAFEGPMVTRELIVASVSAAENSFWQMNFAETENYQQTTLALATRLQDEQLIYFAEFMGQAYAGMRGDIRAEWENPKLHILDMSVSRIQRNRLLDLGIRTLVAGNQLERAWKLAEESGLLGETITPETQGNVLVAYCLAYIARGAELDALTPLLSTTLSSLTTNGNRFGQIHVLTLTAWQQLRLHQEEAAKEHLREAVRLALETGYVGIVQYIPDLKRLLQKVAGSDALLNTAPDDKVTLTEQELRVLALLAADRTYPQAAKELTISLNTVREHVRNLYRKLGVNRRAQAVEAARARGLLPTAPQTQARSMAK